MFPRATYDPDVPALVVELSDGAIAGTIPFPDDAHLVDVDASGRAISIEILTPNNPRIPEIVGRFGLAKQTVAIASAISEAIGAPMTIASSKVRVVQARATQVAGVHTATTESGTTPGSPPARELDLVAG